MKTVFSEIARLAQQNLCIIAALLIAAPGSVATAQQTENLLFVTLDGLRWEELFGGADPLMMDPEAGHTDNLTAMRERFWAETPDERRQRLLPFFWDTIAKEGQLYGDPSKNSRAIVTNGKFFSYPGYNEILTGKADDRIKSNAKRHNPNVTVLEWIAKQPEFANRVAAYGSWDVFPYIINTERSGIPVNAGWMPLTVAHDPARLTLLNTAQEEIPHYWSAVRYDLFTFEGALAHLEERKPRVLYVAFGETDDWAHDGRYDLYLDAAYRTDRYIRRLWETAQSMPEYAGKTSLIMTTDHGRGEAPDNWTGHGAHIAGSEYIWVAVLGPDTPASGIVSDVTVYQHQVAATAAALLGLDYHDAKPETGEPIRSAVRLNAGAN